METYGAFLKYGYPQSSSISRWDLFYKPTIPATCDLKNMSAAFAETSVDCRRMAAVEKFRIRPASGGTVQDFSCVRFLICRSTCACCYVILSYIIYIHIYIHMMPSGMSIIIYIQISLYVVPTLTTHIL